MPSLSMDISPQGPLHKRICDRVRERVLASKNKYNDRYDSWQKAEEATLAFMPERDIDALRRSKRDAGMPQYTTIYVPYSYGMLMTSHTYWTTVFMSRTPVLQFDGRHGETQQQIQALEALVSYQTDVGKALVPWYVWLYDVGKYGVGILGTYWDEQFSIVSTVEEREELFLGILPTGNKKKVKVSRRVKGYTGNKHYNVRPFDFFPDPRVTLAKFQEGEFCAVFRQLGWNTILKRESQGYYVNIDKIKPAKEQLSYIKGESGSDELTTPDSSISFETKGSTDNKTTQGNAFVSVYETYVEVIPSDWGLGSGQLPEKWVFTVTADFKTCIGAQPLGANHDMFPFNVQILEPEGYSILPRGMPEIIQPVQDTVNWLINSHFYNVRKILNGQYVVDPSRVSISDMLDPQPGGIIRLKPNGYGTNPNEAVNQLQAVDVTQNHLRDIQVMYEIGQRATGVNDSLMGVLQGSGRKTATEVRSASTFGINRLKTNAEFFSAMGWSNMGQMIVQNTQQYYDTEQKFKIVGDLMQGAGPKFINVDPESITGFYDFVPVDGTLPIDRFAQANLWKEILGQMRTMPEVAANFDIPKIFEWVAQLAGLKNIGQFRVQVLPPGMQVPPGVQQGNVVPMPMPPAPMGGSGPNANMNEPRQMPNMGATG